MTTASTIAAAEVYYDESDPNAMSWAFRWTYEDGSDVSGPMDCVEYDDDPSDEMIARLAREGVTATHRDLVYVDGTGGAYRWER